MDIDGKAFKRLYKDIFNDEDLFFLLFITAIASVIVGFFIKNNFVINGGSIFIVCGAAIAGVLSYLAIESAREVREKQIAREDIKDFTSFFFELTTNYLSFARDVNDVLDYTEDKKRLDRDNAEAMSSVKNKNTQDYDKASLKEEWDGLLKESLERNRVLMAKIHALEDSYNKVVKSGKHLEVLYISLLYNHKLEGVDLNTIKGYLDDFLNNFSSSGSDLFKDLVKFINVDNENIAAKSFTDYNFPQTEDMYIKLIKLIKSPGMSVYKESTRYLIIKNRSLSIASFFAVVGFVNGFQMQ